MTATRTLLKSDGLLVEYHELRDGGASRMARREAFGKWFRQRCKEGRRADALRINSPEESERFWARTVPGPDGHIYWTGGKVFTENANRKRSPQRWAWIKAKGSLGNWTEIENNCGEPKCVNVDHMQLRDRAESRRRLTDASIIGAVQVLAMRLGRTPTKQDWEDAKLPITVRTAQGRFGGAWGNVLRAAGLDARPYVHSTPEMCAEGIIALAAKIGHPPSRREWDAHREWMREQGHPTSSTTVRNQFGVPFNEAVEMVLSKARADSVRRAA